MDKSSTIRPGSLDKNMTVTALEGEWEWHSPKEKPMAVLGFAWLESEGLYRRLPAHPSETLPPAVDMLADCTAGGQIRFRTNASRIAVRAILGGSPNMYHMPGTGQNGFDVYLGEPGEERYVGTVRFEPHQAAYASLLVDGSPPEGLRTVTINFPLYQSVQEVEVGLSPGAEVAEAVFPQPGRLVFYGTSITQGGCASRPGMSYPQQIGRSLCREVINLGFSGNGKGEPELARIIREIERVDALVLDYESNCTLEGYLSTLEPFIRLYREKNPLTPILVSTKIRYAKEAIQPSLTELRIRKRDFAREVVERLTAEGDANLYWCDGGNHLGERFDECTVDGVHPTDLGFARMAEGIGQHLAGILGIVRK
ncbi:SGNH/GDSL hydrolase family protein [Paenibacillus aurantius]|uniref:SGNH/GDSL hydrolase family protein n=1 Tax=Paenibacillus aurantius TaxID=2918900 RepID=A0AA96RD61_9BACL|nr:SGNH/GDSL hydrolase family protein [Paenibacillus aurantius]WNQ09462.1 SGNH/GDSL hydrolase family protein [Paenibacillus aurantius]